MAFVSPRQREQTAERVAALLAADARIEGVVLVGSMAGIPDRWSDIDIEVVVGDAADPSVLATEWTSRLYDELPVVHHFQVAFGATLVRGFLLDSLLEVDLSFTPAAQLTIWGPAQPILDRSGRVAAAMAEPAEWAPGEPDWPVRPASPGTTCCMPVPRCAAVGYGRVCGI